jgi:hypothetical protein
LPAVAGVPGTAHVAELTQKVTPILDHYLEAMDGIKIREGARTLLEISAAGNKYLQVSPLRDVANLPHLTRGSEGSLWNSGCVSIREGRG